LFLLAQLTVGGLIVWFVVDALAGQWSAVRDEASAARIRWGWMLGSGALFLTAHAVLIQTWRYVLFAWSDRLSFLEAARIWTVSSLARYVPLKLWQIGAMGFMAQRAGVSPVAATGSAVIGTVVNLASGFIIVLGTSAVLLDALVPEAGRTAAWLLLAGTFVAALLLPAGVRLGARAAGRLSGRSLEIGALPSSALLVAAVGNLLAWLLYGLAFQLLTRAVLGDAMGSWHSYVAVYTLSYLAGYLVLVAPAGVGVRESAMVILMPAAGLATVPEAALLAVVSRLWLTLLELLPGTVFLVRDAARRRATTVIPPDAST
jgi:glycosyltransferase 2 family protein